MKEASKILFSIFIYLFAIQIYGQGNLNPFSMTIVELQNYQFYVEVTTVTHTNNITGQSWRDESCLIYDSSQQNRSLPSYYYEAPYVVFSSRPVWYGTVTQKQVIYIEKPRIVCGYNPIGTYNPVGFYNPYSWNNNVCRQRTRNYYRRNCRY